MGSNLAGHEGGDRWSPVNGVVLLALMRVVRIWFDGRSRGDEFLPLVHRQHILSVAAIDFADVYCDNHGNDLLLVGLMFSGSSKDGGSGAAVMPNLMGMADQQ
ncbi:hypothetical protein ACLOJK_027208 [Asimina triloba]